MNIQAIVDAFNIQPSPEPEPLSGGSQPTFKAGQSSKPPLLPGRLYPLLQVKARILRLIDIPCCNRFCKLSAKLLRKPFLLRRKYPSREVHRLRETASSQRNTYQLEKSSPL